MKASKEHKPQQTRVINLCGNSSCIKKTMVMTIQRIPEVHDMYLQRLHDLNIGHVALPYLDLLHMADAQNIQAVGARISRLARISIAPFINNFNFYNLAQINFNRIAIAARTLDPLKLFIYSSNLSNRNIVTAPVMNNIVGFLQNHLTANMRNGILQMGIRSTPGNFQMNDSRYNIIVTQCLLNNPFIIRLLNGQVYNAIPTQRRTQPIAGSVAVNNHATDDRLMSAIDVFNRITNVPLPNITENFIKAPNASMNGNGVMNIGWAVTRGNLLHELGHHLENSLSPLAFATLHSFLRARTLPQSMQRQNPGIRNVGYFFENGNGYDILNPQINAGILFRYTQQTPLRYIGMVARDIIFQVGRFISFLSGNRTCQNLLSRPIDNFFVHNANNYQISYNTLLHTSGNGSTEYLSTTVEIFNHPGHLLEMINRDPLRITLFLYLANRQVYDIVSRDFRIRLKNQPRPRVLGYVKLEKLIHVVK